MAIKTAADVVRLGLPAGFDESLLIRCLENDFGKSKKKGSPMITCQWEVVGMLVNGEVHTKIKRGDEEFIIGGLRPGYTYHPITDQKGKVYSFFQDFWCKSQGIPLDKFSVDDENPDRSHLTGLVMSATIETTVEKKRKKLTEDQRQQMLDEGIPEEEIKGEVIIDPATGEAETINLYKITRWNEKYTGELPAF